MEEQRFIVGKDGKQKRVGYLDADNQIVTLPLLIDNLALDIKKDLVDICEGKKNREETNIDLRISVLNAFANAEVAISSIRS